MFRKIWIFLLYVLIIAVIAAAVIGGFMLMGRPLMEALIVLGVMAVIWISFVVVRKAIIRARARSQIKRILQEEKATKSDLGISEQALLIRLRDNWRGAVKALRDSQLKLRGDPLYVLPWYMIFGKPSSGKSTSLRRAKLLSPKIDFPEHADGSTLNLEWWLYEEAIVIDTAGRYAVPDQEQRDRKEWRTFLKMLAGHKQKEPLSGLVLVVAADRLMRDGEDLLVEEGRQLRASLSDLMSKLEAKPPVYLMITKCDLIPGFADWCDYLPPEALRQSMGYLNEQEGGTLDDTIDTALDTVLARMKELRLLMLERSHNRGDSLLTLPVEMEKLRAGLHLFVSTALKENVYQETPRFRGVYFSSSLLTENTNAKNGAGIRGAFLHHFYTRILPLDRGMTDNLAASIRLRNAVRTFALSVGGIVTVVSLAMLSTLYTRDVERLEEIRTAYGAITLSHGVANAEIASLNRLRELIIALESTQGEWMVPWTGSFNRPAHLQQLIDTYNTHFKTNILGRLDGPLKKKIATLEPHETSVIAGGVVRRINLLNNRMNDDPEVSLGQLPGVSAEYVVLLEPAVNDELAVVFNDLYVSYLEWSNSAVELAEERTALQASLLDLLDRNQGDYSWIVDWANNLGGEPVRLSDFWGGSRSANGIGPMVPSAYTLQGREQILEFMKELGQASQDGGKLAKIMEDFDEYYERKYIRAWLDFARGFDEGQQGLSGRKEWLTAVERMATDGNPYFALMDRLHSELEPITYDDEFSARDLVDYFAEVKSFAGGEAASGGGNSKMALKLLGKAGKVGKMAAKAGKTALKAKKKMGGKSREELDKIVEQASSAFNEYKTALGSVAFSAEARPHSMSAMAALFTAPDTPGAGEGPMAEAERAVVKIQMLIGKSQTESQLFWHLYTGPLRVGYEFMRGETGCHLQEQWEKGVIAELEGISRNKLGNALIGEGGLVWKYIETNGGPFLLKRQLRGYQPAAVKGQRIPWTEEFLDFTNSATVGKTVVNGEFVVRLSSLPTGINQSATVSPYSAILNLQCADGLQTLANYNYNSTTEFKWSLEKCGDVALNISLGQLTLKKEYKGEKAFPEFLADFRDGHRVFAAEEFPEFISQLRNDNVRAIDVNYEISGQDPLLQILRTVPLNAPEKVSTCWG